jgi:hypothetical protein
VGSAPAVEAVPEDGAVPLRARLVTELGYLPRLGAVVFPAPGGGRIDINNFRHRAWTPALKAVAGGQRGHLHARAPDGTSLQMIDRTYGHLAAGADEWSGSCWTASTSVVGA